eukprot:SAG31_NODE_1728_length_7428_cov_2.495975_6_plen_75_part_00
MQLFEKNGTLIERNTALIEKVSPCRVVEIVEETFNGNSVRLMGQKRNADGSGRSGGAALNLPKIRKNALVEIIP